MKRTILLLAFLLLAFNFVGSAQTLSGTTPVKWVSALPATCTTTRRDRVLVYKYTATSGVYYCSAANVWTLVGTNTVSYPLLASDGTAADPAFSWSSDTDTGMYRSGANTLNWSTGGTLRATLSSAGLFTTTGGLASTTGAFTSPVTSTQGTITTSQPFVNHTATWNDAGVTFTNFKSNVTSTASAAGSLLADFQVGGTSQFKVSKAGLGTFTGGLLANAPVTVTQGTITTSQPYINHTATVNNGAVEFTGILSNITNTNSSDIFLMDLQVDGVSEFKVDGGGATTLGSAVIGADVTAGGNIFTTSPLAKIGYTTGAGGAQTQATNKSTAVASNTVTTAITMNAAALNAGTTVAFDFANTVIDPTDTVLCTHESGGTSAAYTCNAFPDTDTAVISVRNNTAGNLSEAIVLRITIIKSVSN